MAKQSLTEAIVRKLEPNASERFSIGDAKARGLTLTVFPSGVKTFYLYRRVKGKPTRILLGHHPEMSVELARERAVEVYADVVRGADPNAEKRAQRKGGLTLKHVFDHFIENRIDLRGASSTKRTHKSRFDTCFAPWADRRMDAIHRSDVIELHDSIGRIRGKTTANRAIQLLRSLFNHASDRMKVELPNPAARLELFLEQERERFLKGDELPRFFAALAQEEDELLRDFFIVTLYTGARRGNVQSMRWADVDLESATWTIPAAEFKTRRPMQVVLSVEAIEILKRRKLHAATQWVFPSRGKRGHLVEPKTAWARLLKRSGLTDLRIHDLRRTLGSWQAAGGSSLPVIGKSLGHTQASTTQIYARLDLDAVRESVAAATAAIKVAGEKKETRGANK